MALFAQLEQKNGLPPGLLDAVWSAESSRGENMQSPKGAQGHFQFMPATAQQYGLDDPNNLQQSAGAAAKMLSDMMRQTGSVPGALAAYNWGIGNLQRKGMQAAPAETRNYIQKVTTNMSQQNDPFAELNQAFSQAAPAQQAEDPFAALNNEFSAPAPQQAAPAANAPQPNQPVQTAPPEQAMLPGQSGGVQPPPHQAGRFGGTLPRLPDNAGKELMADAGNLLAGGVRGAGSIGATLVAPYDIVQDAIAGKGLSLESNRQRRADMDWALQDMGANPDSMAYKGGKLGAEIAGTAGMGGALANTVRVLPGAAKIEPLLESVASGGFRAGGLTGAKALPVRAVGGAITGGASAGLVDPETAGTGALIGGAFPAATSMIGGLSRLAGNGAKSLVEPLYEAGRNRIVGRSLKEFSGGLADDAINNLRNAKSLVPGSIPTVAEAAGVPSLSALQRASVNVSPEAANALEARLAGNNQARVDALQELAGTSGGRATAEAARDDAAALAYRTARQSDEMSRQLAIEQQLAKDAKNVGFEYLGNVPKRTEAQSAALAIRPSQTLIDLAKRPAMQGYIQDAKNLAANHGFAIDNPLTSIDGLHYLKLAMDDALKGTPTTALGRNAKSAVVGMKEILTKEMDAISPVYGLARSAYQEASKPLNQMSIADELLKSVNPLTGKIRANQYASKLSDKTAQTATGFNGATLENTLTPEQLGLMSNIKDDLSRAEFGANAGRPVGTNTIQNLAYGNMLDQFGVPTLLKRSAPGQVVGGLLGKAGDIVYGKANNEIGGLLAQIMLDPMEAAKLMAYKKLPNTKLIEATRKGLLSTSRVAPVLLTQ
ncbi:hypothetical protein NL64_19020 [Pseudomonas fluorescens]|uniref:lytic transglycosylase domain-containing protein n=1 Tax=Pseudomonas fluorescens TaxID=294 RepID=UPI00054B4745|nr:lytic transglycosylase domain-containing protein [Pseudomonas fluorescens]KII30219.1 hypothetical protein NL64_19020 [Pseudomonas fluorescens]